MVALVITAIGFALSKLLEASNGFCLLHSPWLFIVCIKTWLKEVEELGYRRISYLLFDKGYRGIRNNQILRNNDIYSIYKKGKIREERINRDFNNVINDVIVYENVL